MAYNPQAAGANDSAGFACTVVGSRWFDRFIISVILLNAVTLGLEADRRLLPEWGDLLTLIDRIALGIFLVELMLKLLAFRLRFFASGWNRFDFAIIVLTTLPVLHELSLLRILRLFRLFSLVPAFRLVIGGFYVSLRALIPVAGVLLTIMYVFAVFLTKLFGADIPEWFGTMTTSLLTMFQIMTLEGWIEVAEKTRMVHAWAPLIFVAYILLTTFTVLNLLIGVVVNAMQEVQNRALTEEQSDRQQLLARLDNLSQELGSISKRLSRNG